MPKTAPLVPLDDRSYWRRLLATVHPDRDGGDGELFVFLTALHEHVMGCNGLALAPSGSQRPDAPPDEEPPRIAFDSDLDPAEIAVRALTMARDLGEPYAKVLRLLVDFTPADHGTDVFRGDWG